MDNVIKAYFYSGNIARTNTVFQYNRGMILKFMDVDLPATYRVDFANSLTGQSKTCVGTADGVIVPLEMMAKGCTVYAWAVIANEDSTVTEYQAMIPISPRAEPTDEAPNPEQQQVIDQLIAAMNQAMEQTGADVESTAAAAAAAAASAQAAAASEAAATASAQAAAASEQAAAGSASSASADAATAASAASTATQQAGIATSGAETATQKAADAAASAQDAASSKTAAAGSAAAAATSETNAGAAETAAQTAQAAAEAAAQSVSESAAQIEENKEDIADLKSALTKNRTEYNSRCKLTYNEFDKFEYDIINNFGVYSSNNNYREKNTMMLVVIPVTGEVDKRIQFYSSKVSNTTVMGGIAVKLAYDYPDITKQTTQIISTNWRPASGLGVFYGTGTISNAFKYMVISFDFVEEINYSAKLSVVMEYLNDLTVVVLDDDGSAHYADYPYIPHLITDVQEANLSAELIEKINAHVAPGEIESYGFAASVEVPVDQSIVDENTTAILTDCTGDYTNGFVFTSAGGSVEFDEASIEEALYLVTFTMSNYAEGKIFAAFGNGLAADAYFGGANTQIVLRGNGGNLKISVSSYATTITNVMCYQILAESADEILFSLQSATSTPRPTTGKWTVGIGDSNTLKNNVNGTRCIAIGACALRSFVSGSRNIGIGTYALDELISGDRNIAIGADAMYRADKATDNVAIGKATLANDHTDVKQNVAIGGNAMDTAKVNVHDSVGIGYYAGHYSGNQTVYIGSKAGYFATGDGNIGIGLNAFRGASGGANTGANNVAIGTNTQLAAAQYSNTILIGYNINATADNQIVIGNANNNELIIMGKRILFNNDGTVTWQSVT